LTREKIKVACTSGTGIPFVPGSRFHPSFMLFSLTQWWILCELCLTCSAFSNLQQLVTSPMTNFTPAKEHEKQSSHKLASQGARVKWKGGETLCFPTIMKIKPIISCDKDIYIHSYARRSVRPPLFWIGRTCTGSYAVFVHLPKRGIIVGGKHS